MKQKLLIILSMILMTVSPAFAQTRTITGKVTGKEDGLPLPGVSVRVKGTNTGVQTGVDGSYSIRIAADARSLIFTSIGYTAQEIAFGSRSTLDVDMVSDARQLSEVVVTGYGQQQNKKDLTGSNVIVSGKDIANIPVASFDNALAGRASGVQVTSSSGLPGASVSINIRGVNSINAGTQPLYVVDGVEVVSGDLSRNFPSSNALAGINPNDIESINIMKDASAASIYGAQAANGVVIITTKKGQAGKTQVNFSASTGISQVIQKQDVLNTAEFIQLSREAIINRYGSIAAAPAATQTTLAGFGDPATAPTVDWQDAVFRNGIAQNYDLSFSGGDIKTKFYVSASYDNQKGQEIAQGFKRGAARINFDHKVNDKFTIETKLGLTNYQQQGTISGTAFASPNRTAMLMPPMDKIYNDDGTFNTLLYGAYPNNVVQTAAYDVNQANTKKLVGNVAGVYQIIPDLKFRTSYSIDYTNIAEDRYRDPRTPDGSGVNGRASVFNTTFKDFNTDQTLNYGHVFNNLHKVGVIAGMSFKREVNDGNNAEGTGFPNYQFRTIQSAAVPTVANSFYTTYKQLGYFSRVDYSYDDKYLASATVRRDGSSRFGINHRYGTFPAGSVGWRISKESFMANLSWIDDLKLRASYGILGNSKIGNFDARSLYSGAGSYNLLPGIAPTLGNDDLTWEEAATFDLGLDLTLLGGRISASAGGFKKKTSQLLLNRSLPVTSGFTSILQNIGKLENRGLELELNTTNVESGGFRWTTTANATFLESKLLELNDGLQSLNNLYFVGEPLQSINVPRYAGVNPADGNPMYYDINGDITYNPVAADRQIVGSQLPKGFGGVNNTFSYKGLSLSAFVQYQYGNKINNGDAQFLRRAGSTIDRNQDATELRRWQKPGDITDTPKPYYNTGVPAAAQSGGITYLAVYGVISSHFIEDGSYVRLKNVNLAYNLPKKWLSHAGLRSVQVYAQGFNLVTLTKFTGTDPEVADANYSGTVPQYRNIMFGVQVGL